MLHVAIEGSGPPLVLLHGWAMHGGVFAGLAEALRSDFTLYLPDLPGHGHSRGTMLDATLDGTVDALFEQLPAQAPWCGWSLGGLFALRAALREPARVPALGMLCASPRFVRGDAGAGDDWRHGVSAEIFRDFADGLRGDYRGTLERFAALEAFGSDHAREAVRALRGALFARGEPPAESLARGLALLETSDLRDALPRLAVPSLWLAGRRDRLVDPRAMRQAAALAPGAQFVQVEHGGHAPFLTDAGEVARQLHDWLRSLDLPADA